MSTLFAIFFATVCIAVPQQGIGYQIGSNTNNTVRGAYIHGEPDPVYVQGSTVVYPRSGHATVSYRPTAGIVVTVDADAVFKQALSQSWNCLNDQLGRRYVNAKTFSKVDYQIKPMPSFDGALLKLLMEGVSFGESSAVRSEKNEIVVDTLTKFKSRQMLLLSTTGVEYGPLEIKADSAQSFNRIKSSNPLATTLVKRALKKTPESLTDQTNTFARKHIEKNINRQLALTNQQVLNSIHQLFNRIPILQSYGWTFSSDDQFIYVAGDQFQLPSNGMMIEDFDQSKHPVAITFQEDFATRLLNDYLANKQIGSLGVEDQYNAMSKFVQLPKLEIKKDQSWTIDLGQFPASVRFGKNEIGFEIATKQIASDKQTIGNMIIGFSYRPLFKNGFWYFVRDDQVAVRESGDNGKQLGARQMAFRTVMSKRLERVIPKYLAIKRPGNKQKQNHALDLELALDKIQPTDGQMTLGFKTR